MGMASLDLERYHDERNEATLQTTRGTSTSSEYLQTAKKDEFEKKNYKSYRDRWKTKKERHFELCATINFVMPSS